MSTIYFGCAEGVTGKMVVGALLDMDVDKQAWVDALKTIDMEGWALAVNRVPRGDKVATLFELRVQTPHHEHDEHCACAEHEHDEHCGHHHHHEPKLSFADIDRLIEESALPARAKADAQAVFATIAKHGAAQNQTDAEHLRIRQSDAYARIIEVAGSALALDQLSAGERYCVGLVPAEDSWDVLSGYAILSTLCRPADALPASCTRTGLGADGASDALLSAYLIAE